MTRGSRNRVLLWIWTGVVLGFGFSQESGGSVVTLERDFKNFNRLQFSHDFHFEVRQGEEYSTVLRVSEHIQKRLMVVQNGATLSIGLTPGPRIRRKKPVLQAIVVLPELEVLEIYGASQGRLTGFVSDIQRTIEMSGASSLGGSLGGQNVYLNVSGSSVLALGCNAKRTHVKLSGASKATLKGIGGDLTVQASGASRAELFQLQADNVKVILTGASKAWVQVQGRLDINASGASFLQYEGHPTLGIVELSEASKIRGAHGQ